MIIDLNSKIRLKFFIKQKKVLSFSQQVKNYKPRKMPVIENLDKIIKIK